MTILVDNLTRQYARPEGTVTALDAVSFAIQPGTFAVAVGPSGCGKTTLLMTLGGLLRPTAGRVEIIGRDPYALNREDRAALRASAIGFVFQQFHLIPYLNALENAMTPVLGLKGTTGAADRARELLDRFGLSDRMSHLPADLSVGERQRCALARALMNRPKILLADEPTGNLDPDNGRAVVKAIREFASDGGCALMVSHDPDAEAQADQIIRLDGGRLIKCGPKR